MAYRLNLVIDQGSDYSNTIVLSQNTDPTLPLPANTVFVASFRDYYNDPANAVSFTCVAGNTTVNNIIYPTVTLSLNAATTANLVSQNYVYDIVENANGTLTRIREGYIFVDAGVTNIITANAGVNTSVLYDLLTFTYDTANGTFIFGEYVFQTANGVSNGVPYTYNTAVGTITSVAANTLGIDTVVGQFTANLIFRGATSNATANLVAINYE